MRPFFFAEFLKHVACMNEESSGNDVCYNKYAGVMEEIQSKTKEKKEDYDEDVVSYQKKKREAGNEDVKNICWWVRLRVFVVFPFHIIPYIT